ncbi:MAG: hypothetical protein R3F61_29490 [Myxococcota bacterium]
MTTPLPLRDAADTGPDAAETLELVRERVAELDVKARRFIRQNPTTALLGAIAIGFVIGKVVTR